MSQMYDWVTKNGRTWNPLAGACSHHCSYCYVEAMKEKFLVLREKYSGPPRLVEKELKVKFKPGETVFVSSMTDLFAENVPDEYIDRILFHTQKFPGTTFLFQSKNPERLLWYLGDFPEGSIIGTTIETNREYKGISKAPSVHTRAWYMLKIREGIYDNNWHVTKKLKTMISIEPVLAFDPREFAEMIANTYPDFISIGADSKGHGLPEPSKEDIEEFIKEFKKRLPSEIRLKDNLKRIMEVEP